MKAEKKLIKFLNKWIGTDYCSRKQAKYGCLKCQEFYKLLDKYVAEHTANRRKTKKLL
jgi:hypothetical protein